MTVLNVIKINPPIGLWGSQTLLASTDQIKNKRIASVLIK